tara:strand:+ start:12923 stop:13552 length:630 start_codon:yes stop_codon:yes gene_type:complete
MEYASIKRLFDYIITRDLSIGVLDELEHLKEKGTLTDPSSPGLSWRFIQKINQSVSTSAKLFGVTLLNKDLSNRYALTPTEENTILTSLLIQTYPSFDVGEIKKSLSPQNFIVGSGNSPLPFVGGSNQGHIEGLHYEDIVSVFGLPTYDSSSSDGKTQVEWDIKFENGVRSSIYDYKQYDTEVDEITYWSVGGNSPESAFEVYKIMGLI